MFRLLGRLPTSNFIRYRQSWVSVSQIQVFEKCISNTYDYFVFCNALFFLKYLVFRIELQIFNENTF